MNTESNVLRGLPSEKLTPEAEDSLARSGNLESLVLHTMREAFYYARHICRGKIPEDEVFSAVYRALEQAGRNYKPGHTVGVRFFAYAKVYVRGALSREWKSKDVVKHAKHESIDVPVEKTRHTGFQGVGEEEVIEIFAPDTKWESEDYAEPEFDLIHLREKLEFIKPVLKKYLSDHERMVVELHYFANYNFEEIGDKLCVSRSAIQNAHTRALRKIRAVLERNKELFK